MTCFRESSYNKSNSKQDSLSRSRHRPWSEVRSWFHYYIINAVAIFLIGHCLLSFPFSAPVKAGWWHSGCSQGGRQRASNKASKVHREGHWKDGMQRMTLGGRSVGVLACSLVEERK